MNFWSILRTLLGGFIMLYLQVLVAPRLAVAGVIPNLFLGWLVFEVWRKPLNYLIPIIFILGVCYDLTMPTLLGVQTLVFVLLAVGVDEFHRPLEKDSYITLAITLGLACLIYSVLILLVYGLQSGFSFRLILMNTGLFLYNLITSFVITTILVFISNLKLDFRHA